MPAGSSAQETAPWFGCTGMGEEAERHLLEYIRLEENQTFGVDPCTTAADLTYVGKVVEPNMEVHYWQFRDVSKHLSYASISVTSEHVVCDYGSWTPLHDNYDYR